MRAFFATVMPDNPVNLFCLLLFAAIFTGVVIFNLRPSRRRAHAQAAQLPLED